MRPGDRVRVIRNSVNAAKVGGGVILEPGDVIEIKAALRDRDEADRFEEGNYSFLLNSHPGGVIIYAVTEIINNFIPIKDVELISDNDKSIFSIAESGDKAWLKTHQCTCDMITLMRTGCKCFPEF